MVLPSDACLCWPYFGFLRACACSEKKPELVIREAKAKQRQAERKVERRMQLTLAAGSSGGGGAETGKAFRPAALLRSSPVSQFLLF